MSDESGQPSLFKATRRQAKVVQAYYELYLCELSAWSGMLPDRMGKFAAPTVAEHVLAHPDYHVWLVRVGRRYAGFAWVRRTRFSDFHGRVQEESLHVLSQFYILPSYRKQGLGLWAARKLFKAYGGVWELFALEGNTAAGKFWPKAFKAAGMCAATRPMRQDKCPGTGFRASAF